MAIVRGSLDFAVSEREGGAVVADTGTREYCMIDSAEI